jgi:hypothetical protein
MTILKRNNQSDVEVKQLTPTSYVISRDGETSCEMSLIELAVELITLRQTHKIPAKIVNEIALVALKSLMNK